MHTLTEGGAAWTARLLQCHDSAYPTGSYAHSWGLESLCQQGVVKDRRTLQEFLEFQVLPQLGATDLPIVSLSWLASGLEPDWDELESLAFLGRALKGAREPREACEAVGRQRLEMAALLHGGLAGVYLSRVKEHHWPCPSALASGLEGRLIGAPREAVLAAYAYASLSGYCAAAVKLLRLGQNAVQTLLAYLMALIEPLISKAMVMQRSSLGSFNPWWDIAASQHEAADFRLFIS